MTTRVFLWCGLLLFCAVGRAAYETYVDEYPLTVGIATNANPLRDELRREIRAILDAGRLAPLRIHYADELGRGYFLYAETLRTIMTLGYAYPHLSAADQAAVRAYVVTDCLHAVWWKMLEDPPTNGARRELYTTHAPDHGWVSMYGLDLQLRPRIAVLHGLCLYAQRAGDWALISNYWEDITTCYGTPSMWGGWRGYDGDLYGTVGAHLAMVRMATMVGDQTTRSQAMAQLQQQLNEQLDFNAMVRRSTNIYYSWYSAVRSRDLVFQGWCFLNITPEICRFINDHAAVRTAALAHVDAGRKLFPLWWLHQAPYWTRWTGDEGIGLSPEMPAMIVPLERWVRHTPPAQLAAWLSAPVGRGDCYYIENLIHALEAYGTSVWTRHPQLPFALLAPNGGEQLVSATDVAVQWIATTSIARVDLHYSKDNFISDVQMIATNVPNTGAYLWHVPNDPTMQASVRVVSAANGTVTDRSDAPFSIIPEPAAAAWLACVAWFRYRKCSHPIYYGKNH